MLLDINALFLLCCLNIGTPAFDCQRGNVYAMNIKVLNADANYTLNIGTISEQDVAWVNEFYNEVPYTWCIYGDDHTARIVLQKSGMHKYATVAAMGIDLGADLPDTTYNAYIQIKEVDAFSVDYLKAFDTAFEIEHSDIAMFNHYILNHVGCENIHFYVAYYDDIPVSTAMSLCKDANAALFCVGTIPEYRRKGYGYAICHKALSDAKKSGARHAWLLASDMGYPVYKRLGFIDYGSCELWTKNCDS